MFEHANLEELASLAQGILTPAVISDSKMGKLNDHQRQKIRHAMFGTKKLDLRDTDASDQRELLGEFSKKIAGPIIELLPPATAPFAVLMLYEEFVSAVFIDPVLEAEVGGMG